MSQMNMGPGGAAPGGAPGARPGQMTAVMRAMTQATGPKVLRIGVVQGHRFVEERLIKQRINVTVGTSERATFVVAAPNVSSAFKLFELIGTDYHLNFLDGWTGRVALQTGITDIAALKGQAKKNGNVYTVKLTDEARGKVIIGETTFLFQFVAPPPPQPKPQLPLAVKGGLASQIDWNLTIIAAFSFMMHFGFIGAMYSDWMDPVLNEDLAVQGLLDLAKNVPPPVVEEKPVDAPKDKPADKPVDKPAATTTPSKAANTGGPNSKVSDVRAASLAREAESMQMQMLAAFGGTSAVSGALSRSEIPPVDLSGVAASTAGVSNSGQDLKMGGGGGPVQPGKGTGLQGIGGSTTGSGTGSAAGGGRDVGGPKGDALPGAVSASVPVANAEATVAKLRGRFKACYQSGLSEDPTMSGKVVVSAKIGPNGEVENASVASNTGLSPKVAACITRAVKNANFDPPGGSGSTIQIPVSFVQQGK
ncbi:MAG: AgmX/PglI C-terminal domain-containing protein [Polyangiaceae bacterium]